jgi:hypothetical protein
MDIFINENNISVIKILMILYLFIFTNVLSTKINEKIIYKLNQNFILKHIIGLITIGILLSLVYNLSGLELLKFSILIYFIFLLSTKMSSDLIIITIVILSGLYFYDHFNEKKINQVKSDNIINNDKKNIILNNKNNIRKNITLFTIVLVIIGSLLYEDKKVSQYGGSFSLMKFLN